MIQSITLMFRKDSTVMSHFNMKTFIITMDYIIQEFMDIMMDYNTLVFIKMEFTKMDTLMDTTDITDITTITDTLIIQELLVLHSFIILTEMSITLMNSKDIIHIILTMSIRDSRLLTLMIFLTLSHTKPMSMEEE